MYLSKAPLRYTVAWLSTSSLGGAGANLAEPSRAELLHYGRRRKDDRLECTQCNKYRSCTRYPIIEPIFPWLILSPNLGSIGIDGR